MTVLLNDVWYSSVVEFGPIGSSILWAKFKFAGIMMLPNKTVKKGKDSGMTWIGFWI